MAPYVAREASKLWRRFLGELSVEVKLLIEKWKLLLAGLVFQYIHGLAARGVHYLHRPGPVLQDVGFMLLPELGKDRAYISESLFSMMFFSFVMWTFHPFVFQSKRFYTVLIWRRVLAFLVSSQILRIITFYSTQLPGPNYHCRLGSDLAQLSPPNHIYEVLLLNFPRGVLYGCGDLIFSSHMIFTLVFVHTYQKYGSNRCLKRIAWLIALLLSALIIASRKHYSVDVVVAWYTVSLVVFFVDKKLPEMLDRSTPSMLLPMTVKQKDGKSEEEEEAGHNIVLNGNSSDALHNQRQRSQANGKISENDNSIGA